MAKRRMITTRFWSDNFIVNLTPIERYLYLYFLTNEHTTIAGIYELPERIIEFETGVEKKIILESFKKFEGKINYINGWIYIKNFAKHQSNNASVQKGIQNELKDIPDHILAKISKIDTEWQQGVLTLGTECDISKSKSKSKSKYKDIYSHYQLKINKLSKLTDKAMKKIDSRLKGFTDIQLKAAMNNFSSSDWWMDKNSHRGVAWFFDSDDRVDQFLNLKETKNQDDDVKIPDYAKKYAD